MKEELAITVGAVPYAGEGLARFLNREPLGFKRIAHAPNGFYGIYGTLFLLPTNEPHVTIAMAAGYKSVAFGR